MNHTQLLVFDLDGTLIDSAPDLEMCCKATLQRFSLPEASSDNIRKHIGTGVRNLLEQQVNQVATGLRATELLREVISDFESRYIEHLVDETKPYDGVWELLAATRSRGLSSVVLTNKIQRFTDPIVDALQLRQHFLGVYGRGHFAEAKPSALPLIEIGKITRILPANMVMIGDTWVDVLTGHNAGSKTCGVTYGYGDENEDFVRCQPDYLARSPLDILNAIQS